MAGCGDQTTLYFHTNPQGPDGKMEEYGRKIPADTRPLQHHKILLVDDGLYRSATLEACGTVLLQSEAVELYVAALCYTSPVISNTWTIFEEHEDCRTIALSVLLLVYSCGRNLIISSPDAQVTASAGLPHPLCNKRDLLTGH